MVSVSKRQRKFLTIRIVWKNTIMLIRGTRIVGK